MADPWAEFWRAVGTLGPAVTTGFVALWAARDQSERADGREQVRFDREKEERDKLEMRTAFRTFTEVAGEMSRDVAKGGRTPDPPGMTGALVHLTLVAPEAAGTKAVGWVTALIAAATFTPGTPERRQAMDAAYQRQGEFMKEARSCMGWPEFGSFEAPR
jgi:hypothetical protein